MSQAKSPPPWRLECYPAEPDGRLRIVRHAAFPDMPPKIIEVPPWAIDALAENLPRLGSEGEGDGFTIDLATGQRFED